MTNIRPRWLGIGQALFCEANTQLSSPNKLHWFARLSSLLEHKICFILPAHGFNHKIVINNYALLTGCEVKMTGYLHLYWPCVPLARLCSKKWISLVFWATELDTSLSSSVCQPASICRYRAWGLSLFRGDKVKSSSVFQEKKNREKMKTKAIITTWSTKSKTPSPSQFVTNKKHRVAGWLMLFWYFKKILTKKHSFLPFLLWYIWRETI